MTAPIKIEIYVPPDFSSTRARGITIKLARVCMNLSLEELAKKIHRSKDTIRRWERGEVCPDLDEVKAIALVLGQPMEFLR
ncbi:MAG: helix-turn-helix domain-containing protein [Chroococcidiopsis sp.]